MLADEGYVWWAKLRLQPLPNADDIGSLQANFEFGTETHLNLTDHRSRYVGKLQEITADNVPKGLGGRVRRIYPEFAQRRG